MKQQMIYVHADESSNVLSKINEFSIKVFKSWEDLKTNILANNPSYVLIWTEKKQHELLDILRNLTFTFKKLPVILVGRFQSNSEAVNLIRVGVIEVIDYMEDVDLQHLKYSISEVKDFISAKKQQSKEQKEHRAHVRWALFILVFTLLNILVAINYIK